MKYQEIIILQPVHSTKQSVLREQGMIVDSRAKPQLDATWLLYIVLSVMATVVCDYIRITIPNIVNNTLIPYKIVDSFDSSLRSLSFHASIFNTAVGVCAWEGFLMLVNHSYCLNIQFPKVQVIRKATKHHVGLIYGVFSQTRTCRPAEFTTH